MQTSGAKALKLVLAHEGGYVNHPKDPGGATNMGVTQRVYDAFRSQQGEGRQSVRGITYAEAAAIYRAQYWDRVQGDKLPAGLDYAMFDYAVNSGVSRAAKDLQRELGVTPDGVIGVMTLNALEDLGTDEVVDLLQRLCQRRMKFLRGLKTWGTFGKGWTRRVMGDMDGAQDGDHGVIDYATAMADCDVTISRNAPRPRPIGAKKGEKNGPGLEGDQSIPRSTAGVGAITAATGATAETLLTTAEKLGALADGSPLAQIATMGATVLMLAGSALLLWKFYESVKDKGRAS